MATVSIQTGSNADQNPVPDQRSMRYRIVVGINFEIEHEKTEVGAADVLIDCSKPQLYSTKECSLLVLQKPWRGTSSATALSYKPGSDGLPWQLKWGNDVRLHDREENKIQIENVLSILRNCEETEEEDRRLQEAAQGMGKNVLDFVVDYIRELRLSVLRNLERCSDIGATTEIRYKIGAPDGFPSSELRKFKQVCVLAGFGKRQISVVSQMEAIMVACASRSLIGNLHVKPDAASPQDVKYSRYETSRVDVDLVAKVENFNDMNPSQNFVLKLKHSPNCIAKELKDEGEVAIQLKSRWEFDNRQAANSQGSESKKSFLPVPDGDIEYNTLPTRIDDDSMRGPMRGDDIWMMGRGG